MDKVDQAIRQLSIDVVGGAAAVAKLKDVARAEGEAETATKSRMTATERLQQQNERMMAQQARMLEIERQMRVAQMATIQTQQAMVQQYQQAVAANDNYAKSSNRVGDALLFGTKSAIEHGAAYLATAGAIGAGLLVFGSLLAILAPIVIAYKLVKAAIESVAEAWALGGAKLAEYIEIAKRAAAVDLSTSFFQKIEKSAIAAKLPVDDLTAAFKKLTEVSTDKLGGSALQKRIEQLTTGQETPRDKGVLKPLTGNFQGNTGVAALAAANSAEEKFRAVVSLVDQAMTKGERLAALDLAGTALGPVIAENLRKDSDYLKNMLASADKIKATELVSDADIGRALEMQNRYDAAVKILEMRWHPIQNLLTSAGIAMHSTWVNIVSAIASAVDWAVRLITKLGEAPAWFQNQLNRGATAFMEATTTPESRKTAEQSLGISSDPADIAATKAANDRTEAVARLTAGLQNKNAVEQAAAQVNLIQNSVWRDTSKNIEDVAKKTAEARDQYDRAKDGIEKHTARLIADTDAIGLGVGAQEEFRAKAALVTAAKQAELEITPKLTAEIDKLAKAAGVAGQARAEKSAQSQADFARETVFLSDVEKQIAAVNFQLHGDQWKNYGDSALSNTLRIVDSLKLVKDAAGTFASGLAKDLATGVPGVQALQNALKTLASSVLDASIKKLVDQGLSSLASALTGAAGGAVAGAGQAATMTAGATEAAGILTTAGSSVGASILAGATEAANILGLTIPPAASALPTAGALTGAEVGGGGIVAGTALTEGGTVVGIAAGLLSAAMGPIGLVFLAIAAAAAAFGLSGSSKGDTWLKGQIEGMNSRNFDYAQRSAMVGVDSSSRVGEIGSFDYFDEEKREAA